MAQKSTVQLCYNFYALSIDETLLVFLLRHMKINGIFHLNGGFYFENKP